MTSKFRDIAAKHRERRMRVRRREMAFATSQANHHHHHHRNSNSLVPTGQVVSHVKDCNPHDVDVCSSISVSSYSDSTKDDNGDEDDNITNETFGETISESVEDEASSSEQQPNNNNNKPQTVVPTSVAKRHVAAYRRKGRSPMLAKKAAVAPKISVNDNNHRDNGKEQQQKMASPSWANVKLKKSSNINNSDNLVDSGDKNATTTDNATLNKVLTPRTRGSGGYSAGTAAGGSSSSNNNNKQRVVRASTGSSRRRFKASYTYADRPAAIVQSPKIATASTTPRTMMMTTQLRQTGSSFLKESSMSSPRNTTTPTAPLVAKKTSTTLEENDNDDFHEEKKEEHEKVVPETGAAPTSTTTTTVPPPAWSIKLKSTIGNKPSSSKRPTTTAAADADMTMMIQSTDDSQGQDDAQQQPIPPPLQTTSISTSTTASSSSTPPPAWSVKLKSTRAHAATATTANAKNDKKFKARVASTFQHPENTTTFTTDMQSPQTSVSSKNQQQQQPQQVAGSKTTTMTTTHWAPAYAKRAAPIVTTATITTTAVNTTFAALASPAAAAAATQTTSKPVTLASPAETWAQHKLKKTGFDVAADNEKSADAEPPTGTENALVVTEAAKNGTRGDDSMQSPAERAAGVVLSTLRDDDNDDKKPQPMSVPVLWAQKKWNTTSLKQDEDQDQQPEKTSSSSSHPTMKSNAPVAWALKKQTNVIATKVEEQDPVTTNTTTTTAVDNDTNQQRQSAPPPPAWTLRKLKSSIESSEIIIDQDRDKPVVVAVPTPKIDQTTTTLTPKTTSIDDGKNQRRSIRTAPALWVQSNKALNAAAENEHDQAAHDGKETVVPTPRSSSMEQDQSKRSMTPPPPKTETSPLPQGASPLPVWAQISLKKTGIDVAEQHPLEKIITVDKKIPTLDKQQQVVKESSTPKVQLSTNLTPNVERPGGSGSAWNPRVNVPPWAQTTLRNTANNLYEDFLGDNDVQKAKGKPSVALTVIASENSAQIIVPRAAAVDDVGDAAVAPLTQSLTSTSDADGEKFATTMAPWIRAKLKKKMGSDTTVEIWPEDECSNSFATNKSPAVAAITQTCNAEYRGAAAPPSNTPAAIFQVKLRKTGLYNKEIDPAAAAAAAPTTSTPIADGSSTKMAPTPMSAKMAPTPMSISSKMDSSKRQLTSPSWGKTDRRRDCADGDTEAESCTPMPDVVALEPGNEDQTTAPQQPLWSTIKLRKTGIEVVEPTPGDKRVMPEESQAKTHPTVLTVSAAPERRTSSIREPTPRASAEETTPSSAAARAKTPDQSDSNNNWRSSPWPIAMLKKTGFDVTEQSPSPVDSTTDPVERVEENNAKEAVLVVGRVSVVVGSTPKNVMDRIDETEPVNNNNPWSMMKLKRTGFDVREGETFSEPLLKTKDIISTVVEPIEVNRSATTAAVVVEPEQEDSSDEPAAAEEGDTVRQQPVWAQLKLKKTGNLETTASAIIVTATPEVNVAAAGKARHWKKARSNLV